MQEMNVICRELESLNIQAVPIRQGGFQGKALFRVPFILIVGTGMYFQTFKVKPLSEENIRKATAILTNQIYDWNQIADPKGYENTQSMKVRS